MKIQAYRWYVYIDILPEEKNTLFSVVIEQPSL